MGEAHSDVKVENTGSEPSQAYTGQAPASEGEPSPFPYSHEDHLPRLGGRTGTFRTLGRHLTLADKEAPAVPYKEVRSALRPDSAGLWGPPGWFWRLHSSLIVPFLADPAHFTQGS